MYPNKILGVFTLYDIFITVGVLFAVLFADRMAIKRGFSVSLQKILLIAAVAAVLVGYGFAVLFQAFYNFMDTGTFEITATTGMTFYGGFLGGVGGFLAVWFLAGKKFCKDGEAKKRFADVADIAAVGVPFAHALGRLGCLFAGCCHGAKTSAWYGIEMTTRNGVDRYVPIQLFESIFLFALAAVLLFLFLKNNGKYKFPLLTLYAFAYGVWRFLIEFLRGDERGKTIVPFLSPSQLIALLLIAASIAYFAIWFLRKKKRCSAAKKAEKISSER